MKCQVCKKGAWGPGVVLHRMNETGVKGIWRCEDCMTRGEKMSVPEEVKDITDIISGKKENGE